MGKLLTTKEGNLKTGRVAFAVFVLVLVCLGALFKLNRPVDRALMAVRHIFEPRQQAPDRPAEKSGPGISKNEPAEKNGDAPGETVQAKPEPVSTAKVSASEAATGTSKTAPGTGETRPESDKKDAVSATEVDLKSRVPPEGAPASDSKGATEPKNITLDPSGKLKQIASLGEQPKAPVDIASSMKSLMQTPEAKQSSRPGAGREKAPETNSVEKPKQVLPAKQARNVSVLKVDKAGRAITVSPERYIELFKNWQKAGNGGKSEKIPLRVENLKTAYRLFQMKPVALVDNRMYYDLTDGTRISPAVLADYSTTVFKVERPRELWGNALSQAGIRETDRVEVRYYMYEFIKKAIYTRTFQAFKWCMDKGLIDAGTQPGDVDVLGRAYIIEKQGGGRFGVFLPVALSTRNGRAVSIDPACFRGQADIETLQAAGLV